MHTKNETPVLILAILTTLCVVGCGGPDGELAFLKDLVPATGRVTLDGEPLSGAIVTFFPDIAVAGGREATAVTDADGVYELVTPVPGASRNQSKGALPGEYVVSISKIAMPDGRPVPEGITDDADAMEKGAEESVPAKYSDPQASTLKATVAPPKAENNFDL